MESSWLSLIPLLIVIPVAIWTKQVIPGLILGLLFGSYLIKPSPLGGLQKAISYITEGLREKSNLLIIMFLYLFSGLIEIIKIAGGIKGFVEFISTRVKIKTGAMLLTWFSTLGTFSAPTFRIVTITPIMKALLKKLKIPARELAFVIEITSAPIIVLIPIATAFVGYMTSIIGLSLANQGIKQDAYLLFIKSIPFNFFSLAIILLGIYFSFFHHEKDKDSEQDTDKEMSEAEGETEDVKDTRKEDWHDCHPVVAEKLPSRPLNLLLPLSLLLGLTLFITWWDGYQQEKDIIQAFLKADVLEAMVIAVTITLLITIITYILQKISFDKIVSHFIIGGNELMKVILLLTIVWGLSGITEDLGLSGFVTENMDWIPGVLVPPALFLIGSIISYFIGSSWGTWGILMPLGISLGRAANIFLPLIIGAVFASGTFGAFASPLSGNTITTAKILELSTIEYAQYKLKPAIIAAGISLVLYFIVTFLF